MTYEEIKRIYSYNEEGYIRCSDCPVGGGCDLLNPSGFEDCWNNIARYLEPIKEEEKIAGFIEVHSDGNPILIAVDKIVAVTGERKIFTVDGETPWIVEESYEEIKDLLR